MITVSAPAMVAFPGRFSESFAGRSPVVMHHFRSGLACATGFQKVEVSDSMGLSLHTRKNAVNSKSTLTTT